MAACSDAQGLLVQAVPACIAAPAGSLAAAGAAVPALVRPDSAGRQTVD